LFSLATQAQQTPVRIHLSALPQAIQAGPLKFRFVEFRSAGLFRIGEGWVRVEIENNSPDAINFSPAQLYFVGKDGVEGSILGTSRRELSGGRGEVFICPTDRMIAPRARIKETYILSEKLRMPADFYYQDKLVATIQD